MRKIDEFKKLQEFIQRTVVLECDTALTSISSQSQIPYTSLEPDFSEDSFKSIVDSLENRAHRNYSYTEGWGTFKETKSRSEYSRDTHFKIVKDSIMQRFDGITKDLIDNLIEFVTKITAEYITKLKENATAKKIELDAIYEAKLNAEQLKQIIDSMNHFKEQCAQWRRTVDELKGGIDRNVQ